MSINNGKILTSNHVASGDWSTENRNDDYPDTDKRLLDILNEQRNTGLFCDAILVAEGGKKFPVHRNILSASSSYFGVRFKSELERQSCPIKILFPDVPEWVLSLIVDSAYGRPCDINAKNVEVVLPFADRFGSINIVQKCCKFLCSEIYESNCIGIRNFLRFYGCNTDARWVTRFILDNIMEVSGKQEYYMLNCDDLKEILSSDFLNIKSEEMVFELIIQWVLQNEEVRNHWLPDLLSCVRFGLLNEKFFHEKIKTHRLVMDNERCKPVIITALKILYGVVGSGPLETTAVDNSFLQPRKPNDVLFVLGGWSVGSPTDAMETYDVRADRWIVGKPIWKGPRAYHGVAAVGQEIYLIGGFDGVDYFNSVYKYSPITSQWCEVSPMHEKRCYVSTTVHNGIIYACGGYDGQHRKNTAEKFNPVKNQWCMINPMHFQRSDASAANLEDKIYICGGFNGVDCLYSAECYDTVTEQWTTIQRMTFRRSGVGVVAFKDCIYAIGGFNGTARMCSVERFDPKRPIDGWVRVADMESNRSNFATEVLDDTLLVIGGFDGMKTIDAVESYDGSDEWEEVTPMNFNRSALNACVLRGLPNVDEFIERRVSTAVKILSDEIQLTDDITSIIAGATNYLSDSQIPSTSSQVQNEIPTQRSQSTSS